MSDLRTLADPRTTFSPPPGGQMWRVFTCWKGPPAQRGQMVAEVTDARSRKYHGDLYAPATASVTIDGRSPGCAAMQELSQDLLLYRWDPTRGVYLIVFRGPIGGSTDTIDETSHQVTFTAADYRAYAARVVSNVAQTLTNATQESIVNSLLAPMGNWVGAFYSGTLNPDGSALNAGTGVLRTRTYTGAESSGQMVDNLAACINGFDWGVEPSDPATAGTQAGAAWVWYPQRGVTKAFIAEWGVTVQSLTRQVDSTTFANWVRFDGTNTAPGTPLAVTSLGDVIANPQLHPEGVWSAQQSVADVSVSGTLQQQSDGYLALHGQIVPTYALKLIPGTWNSKTDCWLGDTIELRVQSGRLNVDTFVRVVAVDFDIDDNGQERLALTVGRPPTTFAGLLNQRTSTIDALTRR